MHAVSDPDLQIEGRLPTSGGILPIIVKNYVEYAMLTQETGLKHIKKVNDNDYFPYSDISGKKEQQDNTIFDAITREIMEEGMFKTTLRGSLDSTKKIEAFIEDNIKETLIYGFPSLPGHCDITFVVNFDNYYKQFCNEFYIARKAELEGPNRENYLAKKSIALCEYVKLKEVLINSEYGKPVFVDAIVIDENGQEQEEKILVRDYFGSKLKSFCVNQGTITKSLPKNILPFLENNSAQITYCTWLPK
jgi:hypothetical protein